MEEWEQGIWEGGIRRGKGKGEGRWRVGVRGRDGGEKAKGERREVGGGGRGEEFHKIKK